MAEANINLPDETSIVIKGSTDEISKILELYQSGKKTNKKKINSKSVINREGAKSKIRNLIDENYFESKRSVLDVKNRLAQMGFNYENPEVSTALIRYVKQQVLQREKIDGNWVYFK